VTNVLVIVMDTARRDAFEPFGAAAGSTPAVAQLAARGVAGEQAHAAACWTLPSHAAMFTGLLPRACGLARAPARTPHSCRAVLEGHRDRLLAEVFRRAGYATAGVSTNLWVSDTSGFDTGFERWRSVDSTRQSGLHDSRTRARAAWALEAARARVDDGAGAARSILRDWTSETTASRRDKPFFWFVNLSECHSPYLPPRPYSDIGLIGRLRAAEEARRYLTLAAIWRACAGGLTVPDEALERMRHLYARSVRLMDDWLADVLGLLDARGVLDETLVVVTSDHGENFGENGLMAHAFSLDERLTHVPLVAAGPGAGELSGLVSLADLPRALARAAGIGHPWGPDLCSGVAVAEFDPPTGPDDERVLRTVEEWGVGDAGLRVMTTPLTSATDGSCKLVRRGATEQFFDLRSDPLEQRPLDASDPRCDELRAALDPAPATVSATPEASAAELAEIEERMKLLGYM
jgi:arylsulfatase A-like enzyme